MQHGLAMWSWPSVSAALPFLLQEESAQMYLYLYQTSVWATLPFLPQDESAQISHQLVVTSDTLDLVNHQPATHFDRPTVLSGGNIGAHWKFGANFQGLGWNGATCFLLLTGVCTIVVSVAWPVVLSSQPGCKICRKLCNHLLLPYKRPTLCSTGFLRQTWSHSVFCSLLSGFFLNKVRQDIWHLTFSDVCMSWSFVTHSQS